MKVCTQCGASKPVDEFYRRGDRPGRKASCKECDRESTRKWSADNVDRHRERTRRWREANPLRTRQQDVSRNARVQLQRTIQRVREL